MTTVGNLRAWIRPVLLLSPFLALYVAMILLHLLVSDGGLWGDEARYLGFADNLASGFYTPRAPKSLNLWNGPGYPLLLAIFAVIGLPFEAARVFNAVLLFASVVLFHGTVRLYTDGPTAFRAAVIYGLYWPMYAYLPRLVTEPFSIALIAALAYSLCRCIQTPVLLNRWTFLAAGCFSFLALTKVLFGYVILVSTIVSVGLMLLRRGDAWRRSAVVGFLSLAICTPYLTHTWMLTGRPFYWATSGGMSLYWMSTPHPGEFGDWHSRQDVSEIPELLANHGPVFDVTDTLGQVAADSYFTAKAVDNIRSNPGKYVLNILANLGRMLYSYPFSYAPDRMSTFFWIIPNAFVVTALVLSIYPALRARRSVPGELRVLLLIGVTAFTGSALVSAYTRQFYVLAPIFGLWLSFVATRLVHVSLRRVAELNHLQVKSVPPS